MITKDSVRSTLRIARQSLPTDKVDAYSKRICNQLIALPAYQSAQHIACYAAIHNEVDLTHLIHHAWQLNKNIYLPVVASHTKNQMNFFLYEADCPLRTNRFHISEPVPTKQEPIAPRQLNMIIVPLIGFDEHCNRLGQGVGFYDRYLSEYNATKTTIFIGVSYELQKIATLPTDPWDVALDMVITEAAQYNRNHQ